MNPEILKERHSVRNYLQKDIEPDKIDRLKTMIDKLNTTHNLDVQLVTDEPDAFGESLLAHYGNFSNVRNYICLIGPKYAGVEILIGSVGEALVVKAQELGLNTCWVGMTFSRGKVPAGMRREDKIYAVIAIGYGADNGRPHKRKRPEQIAKNYTSAPDWFKRGVDAALLGPSALNQQKFKFEWLGENKVKAKSGIGFYVKIDLGIAMYNFTIGAGENVQIEWFF